MGSSDGKVYIYDVAEKLVMPRDSEWVEMQKNVQSLAASRESANGVLGSESVSGATGKYRL